MKDYSKPAFPSGNEVKLGDMITGGHAGMTLRDYFAAQALGVMCASNVNATGTFADAAGRNTVAAVCYQMADAMLVRKGAADPIHVAMIEALKEVTEFYGYAEFGPVAKARKALADALAAAGAA